MYDFPELAFVTRHGCEPWQDLAVKLMLKWPGLHYSTSAFAPKHYPQAIIDYANTRGADKIIYAGYFPMGLTLERIMTRDAQRRVQGRRVAQVPARQRGAGAQGRVTTLEWHDDERLTPEQRAAVLGPGAPFEIARGRRAGRRTSRCSCGGRASLVEMLAGQRRRASAIGPSSCFPRQTITFAEMPGLVGEVAAVLADEYGLRQGDRLAIASREPPRVRARGMGRGVARCRSSPGSTAGGPRPELAYGVELSDPAVVMGDGPRLDAHRRSRHRGPCAGRESRRRARARRAARRDRAPDRRHRRRRPVAHPLHQRHDRAPEGGDALAPQHHPLRDGEPVRPRGVGGAGRAPVGDGRHRPRRCAGHRSSTSRAPRRCS